MLFPAHIRTTQQGTRTQSAAQHCRNAAVYAGKCLRPVGLEQAGFLAGLIHDCGKFKAEFEQYLNNPRGMRGSVNHTFAGCRLLLERYHTNCSDPMQRLAAELLTVAVGSHHGLFDCIDKDQKSGFLHRMMKEEIGYDESKRNFLKHCAPKDELDQLFASAQQELSQACQQLSTEDSEEYCFRLGLLARLLLSALIEGDRRDTAEFMIGIRVIPEPEDLYRFWTPYLQHMEKKLHALPTDTAICRSRREISDRCRSFADREGGILRLNVPTGSGKTLSSLRYALAHARKWKKRRLIFTSPLLSILDQNADVIREYIGDDHIILEHHSNVLCPENGGELDPRELAVESWNSPVIITTLVQLLNTLFAGNPTSIRKFQSLCDSVIVIDEVQSVPHKMLTLFNLAMEFLATFCNATILLCSATQPALEKAVHPIKGNIPDVIPYDEALWAPFKRTIIIDGGEKTLEEIAVFAMEQLEQVDSLLVVCNRKDEAKYLFAQLRDRADVSCHLSASMCASHRRATLKKLENARKKGLKRLCVSTQVIEAGVDISFQCVIRLAAGMDSVIQAAGRCNRHLEYAEPVPVYVVSCQGENLSKLREIAAAKNATESFLGAFRRYPERFGNDLSSDHSINTYYRKLYTSMPVGYQDYHLNKYNTTLFDLLSCNFKYFDDNPSFVETYFMNQAFRLAGSQFEVFNSNTQDLVVPYGEGTALIAELTAQPFPDPAFLAIWTHKAGAFTVSVYDWQLAALGNAVTEHAGVAILDADYYDDDIGLVISPKQKSDKEVQNGETKISQHRGI